jgi:hypothetical protein
VLYIYARDIPESQGKGFQVEREYYFRVGPQGRIVALSLMNLKQAFPNNLKFHDTLDAVFGLGQNLARTTNFTRCFKVARAQRVTRKAILGGSSTPSGKGTIKAEVLVAMLAHSA